VKTFLKSGIFNELGDREESLTGTPQGGIFSPLLANIALSALDDHFDRQWQQEMSGKYQRAKRRMNGQGNWKIIRYADDFVLMVSGDRHHAEALREAVSVALAPLGLRLASEKTPRGPNKVKRLFMLVTRRLLPEAHHLRWVWWRRRHQARARWFHHRARLRRQILTA
jgi:hypothetical protein